MLPKIIFWGQNSSPNRVNSTISKMCKKCLRYQKVVKIYTEYELVGVSSCVGRTKCWPEYKNLRKQCINLISTPIKKYDQRYFSAL